MFIHNTSNYEEDDVGDPHVAANESMIVTVTNNDDRNQSKELEIRNATNLDYISTSHAPINNWTVSICGRGSEIIVTANDQVCAKRGNDIQRWQYRNNQDDIGIETIGCETHLIVPHDGRIYIYEVNQGKDNSTKLLSLKNEIRVEEGAGDEGDRIVRTISWGPEKTHFVVGYPHKICVWKLDAVTSRISLERTFTQRSLACWDVINVALSKDYVIASCENRRVHIWNRNTGETDCDYLTDVGTDYDHHHEEYLPPLCLTCFGHILVVTSYIGCTLCIFDMKAQDWLKSHKILDQFPESAMYATDMVYLKEMNALLCTGGYTDAWIFPTNQSQYDKAIFMGQRVEMERRTRIHGMPEL